LETSLVTWTFGGDATVLADYALTTTTTTYAKLQNENDITLKACTKQKNELK